MGSSVDQYAVLALLFLISLTETFALINWDSDCGKTKGCFPDCTGGCDYLVTWDDTGIDISFTMSAVESDTNAYLAIGFSDDYRMGDDSVVSCLGPFSSNDLRSYYNAGTKTEALSPSTLGLLSPTAGQTNGVISCTFTRNYTVGNSRFFDLRNDYYIMLVVAEVEAEAGNKKMKRHSSIPWLSEEKVDFQSNKIVGAYKLNSPLVKLHGIMMVFAWLLFSLVGIMTARYNKDMLPETKLFGTKIWFQIHRALMIAMLVCLIIGFIPIFVEIQGYSQIPAEGVSRAHPILGIIILILAFLNPTGAVLRPKEDHKYRWIFNWSHFGLGVVTQMLAIVTVFFGYVMERAVLSNASPITTGVQLAIIVVFVVALELHKRIGEKTKVSDFKHENEPPQKEGEQEKAAGKEQTKAPDKEQTPHKLMIASKEQTPAKLNLPLIALIVFAVVMLVFALVVLGIIASG